MVCGMLLRHSRSRQGSGRASGATMGNDIDRAGVAKAYAAWAPIYDLVFGAVFDQGDRKSVV